MPYPKPKFAISISDIFDLLLISPKAEDGKLILIGLLKPNFL